MRPLTVSRLLLQCLILTLILFCVMVLALKFGAIHVSLYGLGRDLLRVFLGKNSDISTEYSLILNLRLPRIMLGAFVGAALSIAGTSFQALLRNPLADPYVLGVSAGAAVGATLAILGGAGWAPTLPLCAFAGALLAIGLIYTVGRVRGRLLPHVALLAGVVFNAFAGGLIVALTFL